MFGDGKNLIDDFLIDQKEILSFSIFGNIIKRKIFYYGDWTLLM